MIARPAGFAKTAFAEARRLCACRSNVDRTVGHLASTAAPAAAPPNTETATTTAAPEHATVLFPGWDGMSARKAQFHTA